MNLYVRTICLRSNILSTLYRYSTNSAVVEQNEQVILDESDDSVARKAELEKKRIKSGLSKAHFNVEHDRRPYEVPQHSTHLTVKYTRKMYGKYGAASGVNPSLCWPSKRDIKDQLEYESVAHPFTIQQMIEKAAEKRRAEKKAIEERERDIAIKFAKLEQWKKELIDKIARKEADARAAKEKKERLVEEVRRHFGFKLDPRDERFQEMLAKREKEQKKLDKIARKDAKEKIMIAKLQQKNVEMTDSAKKS